MDPGPPQLPQSGPEVVSDVAEEVSATRRPMSLRGVSGVGENVRAASVARRADLSGTRPGIEPSLGALPAPGGVQAEDRQEASQSSHGAACRGLAGDSGDR